MYEDWKQALKLVGEKNDKEDGSGLLFDICIIGDKKTGPPQKGFRIEAIEATKMAKPQQSVPGGRLKRKARKEARLKRPQQLHLPPTLSLPKTRMGRAV